jgi:hypothetical protein
MVESRAEGRNEVDDLATKLGIRILRGASLALALLLATAPAFADERPTVAERLLDILREKELIDDAQYDELLAQAKAERDERAAPAPAKPDPEWKVGWSNGFYFNRSDDSMRLKIGGYTQNDWAVVNESQRLDERFGGVGTGTIFRRARSIWSSASSTTSPTGTRRSRTSGWGSRRFPGSEGSVSVTCASPSPSSR